jgi:hypothetical protein
MLHVCTTGVRNGIVQVFGPLHTGPSHARSSVWVFVLRGKVAMGTGDGGATTTNVESTKLGQWEQLSAPSPSPHANEFSVWAASAGGACFYVDNASVTA